MADSTGRILTTHTGSLPRPDDLVAALGARDRGEAYDPQRLDALAREATAAVVRRQVDTGLDIVNDGEQSKMSYATYVKDRLSGFEGAAETTAYRPPRDCADFPGFFESRTRNSGPSAAVRPRCSGPVAYHGEAALQADLASIQAALGAVGARDAFMTAASPGVIAMFMPNAYYPDDEAYLSALADAMRREYAAIVEAGLILQLDCPDLGVAGASAPSLEAFRRQVARNIEVLNHAVAQLPADRMRLHVCWGNYEGPHHYDVPLGDIVDLLLQARPAGLSFEAANPRHAHEWAVFQERPLPDDKVLIPGALDTTTNFIEHPDLVAERLVRLAGLVGRERVIAGVDCGFATFAGPTRVDPGIAWAKLGALVEGARRASATLWGHTAR